MSSAQRSSAAVEASLLAKIGFDVEFDLMTAFIRKNPFTTADPKEEMIRFVSEHARRIGSPLSDRERLLLASENPVVDEATERRLRSLVASVIANQKASGQYADPKSFVNAAEWAADGEWPYVAALEIAEITANPNR